MSTGKQIENQSQSRSVFDRYPTVVGLVTGLVIFIMLDLLAGALLIPENFQGFRVRDTYYHHGIAPNTNSITNWGQEYYHFYSNSIGFRDSADREVSLSSEKRRVLFMGDSHTEGVGVEYKKTFVGRLASMKKDRGVEILNGSAVSYSPRIHYLKTKYLIEEVGLDFDELFVVIDMSDLNNEIAYENFHPRKQSGIAKAAGALIRKVSDVSAIVYFTDRLVKERSNKFFYENMAIQERSDFELYATFFSEFDNADLLNNPDFHHVSRWLEDEEFRELAEYSLSLGHENIAALKDLCDLHNIPLTISVHPWQDQILKGDTTNLFVASWREFALANEISFVNLYPVFINSTNPVLTASQCYIPHDNHWNERGHELVSRALVQYILKGEFNE